jgi:hypothetical protein
MGLDMYLTKKHYVKRWEFHSEEEQTEVSVLKGGKPMKGVKTSRIAYVEEEVMYWRKANHIHYWFVKHIQNGEDNCQTSYVDGDDILRLLKTLKEVKEDHSKAEKLLPTADGFFFGGTEYDEYYFEEIDRTIEILENELDENGNITSDYYYHASW